jgi:RNA polymerase sigma-70 factor (ECF subfamily)
LLDNEPDLIASAQKGNTEAFEALVREYQQFAYSLAYRVVGNEQEAEDLAQEAFVRAWLALPRFQGKARFGTWLYRIVTNLCYNRLPRLRRELTAIGEDQLAGEPDRHAAAPYENLEYRERRDRLYTEVDALPESYRLLISLYYQQGLAYEEIASVTSLPLGTVKTGLFRAKERLRKAMTAYEEAPA